MPGWTIITRGGWNGLAQEISEELTVKEPFNSDFENWIDEACLEIAHKRKAIFSRRGKELEFDMRWRKSHGRN